MTALAARPELFGSDKKNSEHYPCLKTEAAKADDWWDGLDADKKFEVGSVAIHYNQMSANFRWATKNFNLLTRGQQRIVRYVFSKRDSVYAKFPLEAMSFLIG